MAAASAGCIAGIGVTLVWPVMQYSLALALSDLSRLRFFLPLTSPRIARLRNQPITRCFDSFAGVNKFSYGVGGTSSLRRGLGLVWGVAERSVSLVSATGVKQYTLGFDVRLFQLKSYRRLRQRTLLRFKPSEVGGGLALPVTTLFREFGAWGARTSAVAHTWTGYVRTVVQVQACRRRRD